MAPSDPAERCNHWQLRTRAMSFERIPAIMGIVNVTPDSFSDGGKFYTPSQAVDQALRLEDEGADILDLGGESTRPYSEAVSVEEELRRVEPVLSALVERVQIPISIDTTKSQVARMAIECGAEILNDISGLEADPEMVQLAVDTQVGVCAMHMQGSPQTMQIAPSYENVSEEVYQYLQERDRQLQAAGVAPERICLDPGIGFGKSHDHNLQLARECEKFHQLGRPLLVGHSRKGFIGRILGDKNRARTAGTTGLSLALALKGIQVLRVHDVQVTRDALLCFFQAGVMGDGDSVATAFN